MNIQSPIEFDRIDHVVVRARDIQAMLQFYIDVLGCRLERCLEDLGLWQLRAGDSLIDLVASESRLGRMGGAPPDGKAPNLDHFCLSLRKWDAQAIQTYLKQHGIEVGEVADRYGATGTGPSLYLQDPEGNTIELKGANT